VSEDPSGADNPVVLHALGFCYFFFFELASAAKYLERAIDAAKQTSDSVTLNYAYNGYGISKQYLCEFRQAEAAYMAGLDLAKKLGDDSRFSIIASNLCNLKCIEGDYASSIGFGRRSIDAASRGKSQARILTSYTNIAEAFMLSGDRSQAFDYIDTARRLIEAERSWRVRVAFLSESANLALLAGNMVGALETMGTMETLICGRERAVPIWEA
jgi:tetratricopeptide (TPR) repeat protein